MTGKPSGTLEDAISALRDGDNPEIADAVFGLVVLKIENAELQVRYAELRGEVVNIPFLRSGAISTDEARQIIARGMKEIAELREQAGTP